MRNLHLAMLSDYQDGKNLTNRQLGQQQQQKQKQGHNHWQMSPGREDPKSIEGSCCCHVLLLQQYHARRQARKDRLGQVRAASPESYLQERQQQERKQSVCAERAKVYDTRPRSTHRNSNNVRFQLEEYSKAIVGRFPRAIISMSR